MATEGSHGFSWSHVLEARGTLSLAESGEAGDQAFSSCLLGRELREWQGAGRVLVSATVTGSEV